MKILFSAVPSAFLILLFTFSQGPTPEADFDYNFPPDPYVIEGINNTSSGLASGAATPDGRPLLWKSRDRGSNEPSEFLYYDDGSIPFIGFTSTASPHECYGGINAEGFALENTDAHNVQNGPHNDGRVIKAALAVCRTVDDFAAQLDSADQADVNGRYGYDYGVIDAYGGAAIFEAHQFGHTRFDAIDEPYGFLIRTNFAYTGRDRNQEPGRFGLHRHNRAMERFKDAYERGQLDAAFIMQVVARDLSSEDLDPYPLPFRGYEGNYPYGHIDNSTAICRNTTTCVIVAQGVRAGERPDDAILWSMNGNPVTGIMSPLWVRAGSVPPEYDGPQGSRINQRIIQLYNWVSSGSVDTWKLTNPQGTGLWDFLLPLERQMFEKTYRFVRSPGFHYDRLANFQNEMAEQILDSLNSFKPTFKLNETIAPIFWGRNVRLAWGALNMEQFGFMDAPRGFNVYRSEEPFREGVPGDLIAFVVENAFTDENLLDGAAFYQVEAVF